MMDKSYENVMSRKGQIVRDAVGIDYSAFEREGARFDFEAMMQAVPHSLEDVIRIQAGLHLFVLVVDLLLAWWLARTLTQRRFRA